MGTIQVTPGELAGAGATLQRAGGDLSTLGANSKRGIGTGDLGSPQLEQAVAALCESSFAVVVALWNAVNQTGANVAAAASAYQIVDERAMLGGRR